MGGRWIIALCVAACGRYNFDIQRDATSTDARANAYYAFVTSTRQVPTTFGKDLAGADAICNARAAEAGLPGTYVAWLSTTTVAAIDRSQPVAVAPSSGRTAFLTIQRLIPDAGGLTTADALCSSEATAAGLSGTYRALLATTTGTAISRVSLAWSNSSSHPIRTQRRHHPDADRVSVRPAIYTFRSVR